MRFAVPQVDLERRPGGVTILRCPQPLGHFERAVGDWLVRWGTRTPERRFLAEWAGEGWRAMTYGDALAAARRIGTSLLARGLTPDTPVAIVSDNSVSHALLALGAMHAGIPVAPISPAYSLVSRDHAKLKEIFALLRPGLVFAEDPVRFAPALNAVGAVSTPLDALLDTEADARIDEAFAAISSDSIAKILFTSGSTGTPKGVINTHRMLCSNQQTWAQVWPLLDAAPPVMCDWLPWNHTFGGNAIFNMALRNGGAFYIDGGKPLPGLIETTVRNLRDVAPTLYFNVPRGFDLLLPHLEADASFRRSFFSRLDILFYAGAGLPLNLWERLAEVARRADATRVAMLSGWGSTETAPLAACVHYPIDRPGIVGNPPPGVELKLVPAGDKQEVRVRGPNVTPGYYRDPDLTREAFDDEGFYRIGDAMRLADQDDPARGLVFDGRVAENFKLLSGTWVHAGAVRLAIIAACDPLVQDAVITGDGRDDIGALLFVSAPAVGALGLSGADVRARLQQALTELRTTSTGASSVPTRLLILDEPPSIDGGEITDKGYINQRATLTRRAAQVEELYAAGPGVWHEQS